MSSPGPIDPLTSPMLKVDRDSGIGADFTRILSDYQTASLETAGIVQSPVQAKGAPQLLAELEKVSHQAVRTTLLASVSMSATGAIKKLMSGS